MTPILHSIGLAVLAYLFVGNAIRALTAPLVYSVPDDRFEKARRVVNISMQMCGLVAALTVLLLTL